MTQEEEQQQQQQLPPPLKNNKILQITHKLCFDIHYAQTEMYQHFLVTENATI